MAIIQNLNTSVKFVAFYLMKKVSDRDLDPLSLSYFNQIKIFTKAVLI